MAGGKYRLLVVSLMTVAFAAVPYLFWRAAWFGGTLSDADLQRYLSDKNPRNVQHALAQAAERLIRGQANAGSSTWYPQVAVMANHPRAEIRSMAAWVMGQDNTSLEFHAALLRLIHDREPLVRRNAALSLVRFGDLEARPELLCMLHPYSVGSPGAGRLIFRLGNDDPVKQGTLLARLAFEGGGVLEIRSPLPGRVLRKLVVDGQTVKQGELLIEIAPAPEQLWEALRALVLMGRAEDLADLEKVGRSLGETGYEARVRQQIELTSRAIKSRL